MILTPRIVVLLAAWLVTLLAVHHYLDNPVSATVTTLWRGRPDTSIFASTPASIERAGEDWLDSVDPLHRAFSPLQQDAHFPRLKPTRFLPQACLESWLLLGQLECDRTTLGAENKLDIVWLWVNGSDSRWQEEFEYWHKHHKIDSAVRHFREQNELVYSIRSVLASLKGMIRTCHLILWDTAFDPERDMRLLPSSTREAIEADLDDDYDAQTSLGAHLQKAWRVVQTPSWLNFARTAPVEEDGPRLRYAAHSEIYRLPNVDSDGAPLEPGEASYREREWKKTALPTYDSMSIESRIAFLPDMADAAVAFNDDYFLLRPLAVSDFHSPLYGSILRFKPGGKKIQTQLNPNLFGFDGEFGGLFHANWLLSQRYPIVERPYLEHVPKVITQSLQVEATLMFDNATTSASSKRFRELKIGHGDLQTQWLQIALRVERWREAMLWTWAVAKLGGADGIWGAEEREEIARLLGKLAGQGGSAEVKRGARETLKHVQTNFAYAGWGAPKGSEYLWSSLDGHMPNSDKTADAKQDDKCSLDLADCFDSFWREGESTTAAHMFKHLAFRRPECGDCLLMALVTASGPLGLKEIFPAADASYTIPRQARAPTYIAPPHLPMTPTWEEADFSLGKAVGKTAMPGDTVLLRQWTMHLLSRYLYTYAHSNVVFEQLRTPEKTEGTLKFLTASKSAAVLCLNDDIERNYTFVRDMVGDWFEKTWPVKAGWERE